MAVQAASQVDFGVWAAAIGAGEDEVKAAWEDLRRRGLVSADGGKVTVSALAMRRATSDVQRRLASHLDGFILTENSHIVRRDGNPPGIPYILDTRIAVEYIANYFRQGASVVDILEDLPQLTWGQIEAAIQYYLNHRDEIEADIRRSEEIYEANVRRQERIPA